MSPRRRQRRRSFRRALPDESVGGISALYLGNILYALELAALSLDDQGKPVDAAYYRGLARKLAEAHGRDKQENAPSGA